MLRFVYDFGFSRFEELIKRNTFYGNCYISEGFLVILGAIYFHIYSRFISHISNAYQKLVEISFYILDSSTQTKQFMETVVLMNLRTMAMKFTGIDLQIIRFLICMM
ncbi:hypothetical protein ACP275_08G105500 [Erythranthe tilingii]